MNPCTLTLLAAVILALAPPALAEEIDLKKLKEIATVYDQYTHTDKEGTWEKGELLPTAKPDDEKAWTVEGGKISIDKEGMKLVANPGVGCYVTLANKTFKGPVGIRYEAMTPAGQMLCDLSVRFGPAEKPPILAFAFGGYANSQNFFYIGKHRKVLPDAPLITGGQWHTVEFMAYPETLLARVDNKQYGKEKLPQPVHADAQHDVTLYVWATTGIFRNVQMLKYVPPVADPRTWEEVMGKVTKEQLKAHAEKVGPMLGDESFTKREAAEEILFLLRPLSDDAVRTQLKSADPEVQSRATQLAQRTGLIKAEEKPRRPATLPAAIRLRPRVE